MIPFSANSWPLHSEASDPWAGAEWVPQPARGFENHRRFGGQLGEPQYQVAEQRFMALLREILRGDSPRDSAELQELCGELSIPTALTHDRRDFKPAPMPVAETLLCDVVEDYVPDVSCLANDRYLGPWADLRPDRPLRQAAASNAAFMPLLDGRASALERWANNAPRPPIPVRAAARSVRQAPPMLWLLQDGWSPALPLAPQLTPSGPVIGSWAPLGTPTVAVVARVYPVADGSWRAFAAVGLTHLPPLPWLRARLELELLRLRRVERRASWEDMLRARAEVLYRSCASWCWWAQEER